MSEPNSDDFFLEPSPEFRFKPAGGIQQGDGVMVSGHSFNQSQMDGKNGSLKNLTEILLDIESQHQPEPTYHD